MEKNIKQETPETAKTKSLTIIQLVEKIVNILEESHLEPVALALAKPYCQKLGRRYNISAEEAMWLAMLINWFDDRNVRVQDFARFLCCKPIAILAEMDNVDNLKKKNLLRITYDRDNDMSMSLPADFMLSVRQNKVYVPQCFDGIDIEHWLDCLDEVISLRDESRFDYSTYRDEIKALKDGNGHLKLVQKLNFYKLRDNDEDVLLRTIRNFVFDNDEQINIHDIEDILPNRRVANSHVRAIGRGEHNLQLVGLIENINEDGRANAQVWHLTDKAKEEFLSEVDLAQTTDPTKGMILAESLSAKQLYFNAEVTKSVNRLRSLLSQEQLGLVQDRLEKRGMRRGFTCIFYGAPGTGKTETVYQLARETGRNIMLVDVPNMRSKWVGETEKNIKAVFDRYRAIVKKSKVAPILLFNEADAVISTRTTIGGPNPSVEKMENAMQNIILQEMENLDGIMIATTNLTENLDGAFERRFLYKIQFPKPTPAESKHIWKAMLPDLNEDQAFDLASSYDFSGGQIENIARKQIVDAVLNGQEELDMSVVHEACSCELLKTKKRPSVGFA